MKTFFIALLLSILSLFSLGSTAWAADTYTSCAGVATVYNEKDLGISGANDSAAFMWASPFTVSASCDLNTLGIRSAANTGTPTDSVQFAVWSDSGSGYPGSVIASSTAFANTQWQGVSGWATTTIIATLSTGTTYWLVGERTGAADSSNFYTWDYNNGNAYGAYAKYSADGSTWSTPSGGTSLVFELGTLSSSTVPVEPTATSTALCTYFYSGTTTPCTQIVDNPTQDLSVGVILFWFGFVFVVWFFRRRGN